MPFLFLIVGAVMIVSAVKGTNTQLLALLKADFTGKGNFLYWTLSILVIGALGYIEDLKPISRAFLVLVLVGLFIANDKNGQNIFTKFVAALNGSKTFSSTGSTLTSPLTNS